MSHSAPHAPGRRSAERRRRGLDVTTLVALVVPLLCAAAVALVRPATPADEAQPPTRVPLTSATVVCPPALDGAPDVALTSAVDGVAGSVQVGLGERRETAGIASGKLASVAAGEDAVAVTAEDEVAPGLVAARFGDAQTAAVDCPAPVPDSWFTGVGAGAGHRSVLELTNPDSGTAVADITVHGRSGVVDVPRLRGVSVAGGTSVRLDLASIVPRRDELALHVVAARGRIGATVLDRYDRIGSAEVTEDWLPAQDSAATDNLLMGLAPGQGRRALVVANDTDDEVRADLRVVTAQSVFRPQGLPEIRVPAHSVQRVDVSGVLGPAIAKGGTGIVVTSTGPVTATVRSIVGRDLSHTVPVQALEGAATVLLPTGDAGVTKTVELAGADRSGTVTVVSRSASGEQLDSADVEVSPDHGITVELPAGARLVTVTPERARIAGAVLVTGGGAAVVQLRRPATNGLVPSVGPGLP